MKTPKNIRNTDAYRCSIAMNACSTAEDIADVIDHHMSVGLILDHIIKVPKECTAMIFKDGSGLICSKDGSGIELEVVPLSLILKVLIEYTPFDKVKGLRRETEFRERQ